MSLRYTVDTVLGPVLKRSSEHEIVMWSVPGRMYLPRLPLILGGHRGLFYDWSVPEIETPLTTNQNGEHLSAGAR